MYGDEAGSIGDSESAVGGEFKDRADAETRVRDAIKARVQELDLTPNTPKLRAAPEILETLGELRSDAQDFNDFACDKMRSASWDVVIKGIKVGNPEAVGVGIGMLAVSAVVCPKDAGSQTLESGGVALLEAAGTTGEVLAAVVGGGMRGYRLARPEGMRVEAPRACRINTRPFLDSLRARPQIRQ